ncbi:hypothetical protein PGB90_009021 [Kerria lacca]
MLECVILSPQKLIAGDPDKVQSYVFEKMIWVVGPTIGSGLQFCHNYCLDRPYHAGIHRYFFYSVACTAIMFGIRKYRRDYYSYRDQVHQHYVLTHPEDFPAPEKKKIAEKWEPWVPIR